VGNRARAWVGEQGYRVGRGCSGGRARAKGRGS